MPKKKVTKPDTTIDMDAPIDESAGIIQIDAEVLVFPSHVSEVVERAQDTTNETTFETTFTQTPTLTVEPVTVSSPALRDGIVRVRNQGNPFLCDLTAYGYGMRWPTNAVYSIPASKYVELLNQGLDGVGA